LRKNKIMKKNILSEDVNQMMALINYDRGKTLTENRKEIKPILGEAVVPGENLMDIASAAGWGALAGSVIPGVGTALGAAIGGTVSVLWDSFGPNNVSPDILAVLNPDAYLTVARSLQDAATNSGLPKDFIYPTKIDVISTSEARSKSQTLYTSMKGGGTYEEPLAGVFQSCKTMFDVMRVAYAFEAFGEGEDLVTWLKGDLGSSEFNKYVTNNIKGKPYMTFEGKDYTSAELLMKAIAESIAKEVGIKVEEEANTALLEKFNNWPCVQEEIKKAKEIKHPYKGHDDQVYIVAENGDLLLVATSGKYVGRTGGEKTKGTIECPDDFTLDGGGELSLDESKFLFRKANLFEQSFGGVTLIPDTPKEEPEVKPKDEPASRGVNKCTFDQIIAGKCTAQKGDKGPVIEEIQNKLITSDVDGTDLPKHGADSDFGSETLAAVISFQKANKLTPSGIVDVETAKVLQTGGVASNEQTDDVEEEEEAAEVVTVTPGTELKVGDSLVVDSEDDVDVIKGPNGQEFRTTDDLEKVKFRKNQNIKKIKTDTQVIKFDRNGKIKTVKDRKR